MEKMELLAPAGDLEKLKIAIDYGADAVYFGGSMFGLRAGAGNLDLDEMKEGLEYAHARGAKAYMTVNVFAHNEDIKMLPDYLESLKDIPIDAFLVSDPGIYEESFECNRRKKAGSISRKRKAYRYDRKQAGKKFRKPDHINRRTGDHGISGSSDRDRISDICKSNLSDKGEERITCGWRYCSLWRRRTGTGTSGIKEYKRHCGGSIVSPGLSGECGIL